MWLENMKELKKRTGMSSKQIAEKTGLPERTVIRIFSGDTDNPYIDTLHRIVTALDGSLDEIFADTKTVIGTERLATLQESVDALTSELNSIKGKFNSLVAENEILRLQLKHKTEELNAIYDYYHKLKSE